MDAKKQAFEAMMRANGPKIYTLALRLSGREADAQDIAQEAFIKAFEHWDDFRGEADAATWLYRICVNCWKNRVRYERRRSFWKHFSLDGGGDRADEDALVRAHQRGDRRAARGRLPEQFGAARKRVGQHGGVGADRAQRLRRQNFHVEIRIAFS
jgi:RNA polymerase sigma factor (sigma-70 family)